MIAYPALKDASRGHTAPLGDRADWVFGRSAEADWPLEDLHCSRRQFRLFQRDGRWWIESLSASVPTTCDLRAVERAVPVEHGAVIRAGRSEFRFLERADATACPSDTGMVSHSAAGPAAISPPSNALLSNLSTDATVFARPLDPSVGRSTLPGSFPIEGTVRLGREAGYNLIVLPHPHVSRRHAMIQASSGQTATIVDLRSANGTFVNGRRIAEAKSVRPGDRIDLGPFSLIFDGSRLIPSSRENNVELVGRNLVYRVRDRVLVNDVSIALRPREFAAILGPSGSGKSTLLSLLAARLPATSGSVSLNGKDLIANFEALKGDLVVVPQQARLHEALSVEQALRYTARLRLPPDSSPSEIDGAVADALVGVGLSERRTRLLHTLSGGEYKRACLASELLGQPTLLFLDEVTSGLDEQSDREMMALLRNLADRGKTIVCVTHTLAHVERYCHRIAVLAPGGKLSFVGPPEDALRHYSISRLGEVYDAMAKQPPGAGDGRRPGTDATAPVPEIGERAVHESGFDDAIGPASPARPRPEPLRTALRQGRILAERHVAVLRRDPRTLGLTVFQTGIIALLLVLVFGDLSGGTLLERGAKTANLGFLLAVSCFWFGCNVAAKELVKERALHRRERDANLRPEAYYFSKFAVLGAIGGLQTLALWCVVFAFNRPGLPFAATLGVLTLLALAGTALGLAISALSSSEDAAATAVPIAIIPQIVLADAITPLVGIAKVLGFLGATTFWGVRGIQSLLDEKLSRAAPRPVYDSTAEAVLAILVQIAILIAIGLATLCRDSRRQGGFPLHYGRTFFGSRISRKPPIPSSSGAANQQSG